MNKIWLIAPIFLVIAAGVYFLTQKDSVPNLQPQEKFTTVTPQQDEVIASFEIYTLGTKRIFSSSMYHNLSKDVYITPADPSQVYVKKVGTTWADFFATLPMKLEKDCLTTGTGQSFCTNDSQKLKFFINGQENLRALNEVIKDGDTLIVIYD